MLPLYAPTQPRTSRARRAALVLALTCAVTACGDDEDATPRVEPSTNNGTVVVVNNNTTSTNNAATGTNNGTTSANNAATNTNNATTATNNATTTPPEAIPQRLDVAFNPRLAVYSTSVRVLPEATVYSLVGEPMEVGEVTWTATPADAVNLLDNGRWELLTEGEVTFEGCTAELGQDEEPVCGAATLVVDNAPPEVVLTQPTPGSELTAAEAPMIVVEGFATDTHGDVQVFVQGQRAEVGEDGAFRVEVEPRFGVNHIEVLATDGLQSTETLVGADVLWAIDYLPTPPDAPNATLSLERGIELRLGQSFMDDGTPIGPEGFEEDPVVTRDLADVLELLLAQIDLLALLPNPISDTETFQLAIEDVTVPSPEIELTLTDTGLELFVRLPNLEVQTNGGLDLQGEQLDLTGSITATASAFAQIDIVKLGPAFPLGVDIVSLDLAVERASSRFNAPEANALFEVAEGALRGVLEDALNDTLEDVIFDAVPAVIADALQAIDELLRDQRIPLEVDVLPPTELVINGALASVETRRAQHLNATLDVTVGTDRPTLEGLTSRGVPLRAPLALSDTGEPLPSEAPFLREGRVQLGARMALINGLLHTLWRSGLFELDVTTILPDQFAAIIQDAALSTKLPPVLLPAPPEDAGRDFVLTLGQAEFTATFLTQTDTYGVYVQTGVDVVLDDTGLVLTIDPEPSITLWPIASTGDTPTFEADALKSVIEAQLWPLLADALGESIVIPLPDLSLSQLGDIDPSLADFTLDITQNRPIDVRDDHLIFDGGLEGTVSLEDGGDF